MKQYESGATATGIRNGLGKTFSSLQVRNYRLFISGQLVSLSGTWMQTVALGWLVLQLTDSGRAVGITLALQFAPILFFGMYGGIIADRFDKRRILIVTQSCLAVLAATLWVITASGVAELWMIYLTTVLIGFVTAADNPTRQSFVMEMVGGKRVPNAVSLNSAVFNASRIVGPAIAGLMIATVGLPWTFLLNALTFIAVITGLVRMNPAELIRNPERAPRAKGQIRAGLRYVWSTPRLRQTILLVTVVATFGLNFSVVLPVMARFTFGSGASTFGFLTSCLASGALVGALVSAARAKPTRRHLLGSAFAFGALTLVASTAPSVAVLAVILVPTGAASITFIASANATLQLTAEPHMRGRVMALHGLVFLGTTPLGAPFIGWISETWGARWGLATGGGLTLLAASAMILFVRKDRIEERLRDLVPPRVLRLRDHGSDRSDDRVAS